MSKAYAERAPQLALVRWGLRKFPLVIVACALGLGGALPLVVSTPAGYHAESRVVARQLEMAPAALPSYARAVFASDALRQRVAAAAGLSESDVADRLNVVVLENTVVLGVRARANEPRAAAQLADVAAEAYVVELNKGGSGVGTFELQSRAQLPTTLSSDGLSRWVTAVIGAIAGGLLGVGLVLLLAAAQRPVLRARDVASAVRQRLLGVVVLPAISAGQPPDPRAAPGLVPVARALLPLIEGSVVFASAERAAAARGRLLVLLAMLLSRRLDVFVSGSPGVRSTVATILRAANLEGDDRTPRPALELVDGAPPADTLDVPQWRLPVVLVIRYGEPRASLRRLAADHYDEEILGVVILDERRVRLPGPGRSKPLPAPRSAPAAVEQPTGPAVSAEQRR